MPQNSKRRQQSLQRKATKRKQKARAAHRAPAMPARTLSRAMAAWPLLECMVARDWRVEGELVQVLVARRAPDGRVAIGTFLVDLCCLGVKDAFGDLAFSEDEYRQEVRQLIVERMPMVEADLDLAAKIVREGVDYARQLGFRPNPDYAEAALMLEGADPDACPEPIPLGMDGKPYFIAGPYDDVPRIVAQLTRAVGPGNFDVLAGIGAPPDVFN